MAREKSLAKAERPELERYEPWNTFRDMERMFRDFFISPLPMLRQPRWWPTELRLDVIPEVDLKETDKELVLSANLPGLNKDDFNIDVTKDTITVTGERKSSEEKPGEKYHIRQQSYGSFTISYALPVEVRPDEVKATYKNGVLEVLMPKAEVTEAHKVDVKVEG
ncbi:MAG: Hsp20/alpha crystallin family protein [Armatimonadetes bacterium]|nr:Hsp20/alpha crystallin family protein [Armatimonadota bacterium]